MNPQLVLDAQHVYRYDGKVVPGVTSLLDRIKMPFYIHDAALEKARAEGIAIHKMVELECLGDLDAVPEWMAGHLTAWHKFVAQTGFVLEASEHRVWHPVLRYAGTLDLCGVLTKLPGKPKAIIDIKRSFYNAPAIGAQLAAYKMAYNYTLLSQAQARKRFGLQLRGNGLYSLRAFEGVQDEAVFMACLTLQRFEESTEWKF
jgi:hypothetical protein